MNQHIQQQVDQLLLEQGEYQPLELLLQEGRLSYNDYESWRNGELEYLGETLFGDLEHIQQQLIQAENYLQQRGWQADTISYPVWRNHRPNNDFTSPSHALRGKAYQKDSKPVFQPQSGPVCFSSNNKLDQCFHRRYRKPEQQPQLDLFTDTPGTSLFNGIIHGLISRDAGEAQRLLQRLYEIAPDHIRLGELEHLVEAAQSLQASVQDAASDLLKLQKQLIPLADSLLGKDSRNLIIPLWRRLSKALQNQPFQSTEPELHLSYTATQAMDWDTVRQAVEQEPNWQTDPVLLLRHAWACDHLHQQTAALLSWFNLCWLFPEQCNAIESSCDHPLRQQWIAFLELEPELPAQSFPAWLLLRKPGLTRILPKSRTISSKNEIACPASYLAVYRLQHTRVHSHAERGNEGNLALGNEGNLTLGNAGESLPGNESIMPLRAQIKEQDPVLYQHFLRNIDA